MTAKEFIKGGEPIAYETLIVLMDEFGKIKQRELLASISATFQQGIKDNKLSFSDETFAQAVANTIKNFPLK